MECIPRPFVRSLRPFTEIKTTRSHLQKTNSPRSSPRNYSPRQSPIPPDNSHIKRPTWLRGNCESLMSNLCHMKQKRAGVIPYIIVENKIYFCFGIDGKSGEYTDFGGPSASFDGDITDTALRTLRDKSFGIFRVYTRHLFREDTFFVFDDETLTILINVGHQKDKILESIFFMSHYNTRLSSSSEGSESSGESGEDADLSLMEGIEFQLKISSWFRSQKDRGVCSHMRSLEWLSENKVIEIISMCNPAMYSRLRCLIRDISKFAPIIIFHPESQHGEESEEDSSEERDHE